MIRSDASGALSPAPRIVLPSSRSGEPLGWQGIAGGAASFGGVVLLAHPPFLFGGHEDWGQRRVVGMAVGLLSALGAAAAFVSIR